MKKIILLLTAVLFTASGCSLFGTMFSESRKNFDDKIERVDAYLQSQGCQLTEYTATQGQEQYIISPKYKYQGIESINKFAIENQVYLSASIMANNINKGKIYLLFQTALITDNTTNTHIDLREKTINELTFTYDGKKITLATKKAYDTYLFGSTQFMYSDIKLMKEKLCHNVKVKKSSKGTFNCTLAALLLGFVVIVLNILHPANPIIMIVNAIVVVLLSGYIGFFIGVNKNRN